MNQTDKIEYWLNLADEDLITAEIVLESKRYLHFGFLAHLATEKYIKAFFCFKINEEPPMSHNLLKLSEQSTLNEIINEDFKQLLYKLMPLNIEARYPSYKSEIYKQLSNSYCDKLLTEIKGFEQWIKRLIII
jgi:HEPN domain-containing protein